MFGAIFAILPLVIKLVPIVEELFGKGQGGAKRDLVVQAVEVAVMAAEGVTKKDLVDDKAFAEGIGQVVDGVVATLKAAGQLKPKA